MRVSIHAPNEGSDNEPVDDFIARMEFQSTLPMKGATSGLEQTVTKEAVSIHAPNEGSDEIRALFAC